LFENFRELASVILTRVGQSAEYFSQRFLDFSISIQSTLYTLWFIALLIMGVVFFTMGILSIFNKGEGALFSKTQLYKINLQMDKVLVLNFKGRVALGVGMSYFVAATLFYFDVSGSWLLAVLSPLPLSWVDEYIMRTPRFYKEV